MDGIIALGHFCETHGPCIILSTQKYAQEPVQKPHSLIVPWCEACQSLQLDQAFISKDEFCYVTTRTPLQQEDAFLLRQATVRSLSCEQEGTLYFGDSERGHVYSQTFSVHDALARGFKRKYTIMILMRDKLRLLNAWSVFSKHIDRICADLVKSSADVNRREQKEKSQKSQRQAEGSPSNVSRSLGQLTGKIGIWGHLHLWFAWILGCPTLIESDEKTRSHLGLITSVLPIPTSHLRLLKQQMGTTFGNILLVFLNGAVLQCQDKSILNAFNSLWSKESPGVTEDPLSENTKKNSCFIYEKEGQWEIETTLDLSVPKSQLQRDIEGALSDTRISERTLEHFLQARFMAWINIAQVISACPVPDISLLNSLNVAKNDIPILSNIISKFQLNLAQNIQIHSHLNAIYQK